VNGICGNCGRSGQSCVIVHTLARDQHTLVCGRCEVLLTLEGFWTTCDCHLDERRARYHSLSHD
jgi:hypothetical protein